MAPVRTTVTVLALLSGFPVGARAQHSEPVANGQAPAPQAASPGKLRPKQVLLLSAVLPGAGQIYNRTYWKLPLVYGALGVVGDGLYQAQTRYREYATGKQAFLAGKTIPELTGKLVSQEKSERGIEAGLQRYRTQRDLFIGYMALTYSMVALDAFVDAHLREFDISENLALRLKPGALPLASGGGIAPGLQLQLQVKALSSTAPAL